MNAVVISIDMTYQVDQVQGQVRFYQIYFLRFCLINMICVLFIFLTLFLYFIFQASSSPGTPSQRLDKSNSEEVNN